MIDRAGLALVAPADDSLGHTKEELDEVGVVHMQVQRAAAAELAVGVEAAAGVRCEARETRAEHLAVGFFFDCFFQIGPAWPEAHALRGHGELLGFLGDFQQLGRLFEIACQRLFDEQVLARFQCCDAVLDVQRRDEADVDELHVRIVDECHALFVFGDRVEVEAALGLALDVALGELGARELGGVLVADSHDLHARVLGVDIQVRGAHHAQTDDADVDHGECLEKSVR